MAAYSLPSPPPQVMVTQTGGFTCAQQARPFGDILIRRGTRLVA